MASVKAKACEVILYQEDGWEVEAIISVIEKYASIKVYAIILHDQDLDEHGDLKKAHFHVYLSFGSTSLAFDYVAGWFHTDVNAVEKIHARGRNSRYDYLLYQLHWKQPEKHQYQIVDITANFDVEEYFKKHEGAQSIDEIVEQIEAGIITRLNFSEHIDITTYVKHKQQIERAFEYCEASMLSKTYGDRSISVIWISGSSKTGKTTLVKLVARNQKEPLFITDSGSHPFDGYSAQKIICLDEIRPNSPLPFQELLQFLDNNTVRAISARYHNKIPIFEIVFITSIYSPEEFFLYCQEPFEEAVQLYRRITELWKVTAETISIQKYDFEKGQFVETAKKKNPVPGYLETIARPELFNGRNVLETLELRYMDEQLSLDDSCLST